MQESRPFDETSRTGTWHSPAALNLMRWVLLIGASILLVFTSGLLTRAGWATDPGSCRL